MRVNRYDSVTIAIATPSGKAFVQILEHEGEIEEIFMHIGKAGTDLNAYCFALTQMTCQFLKMGNTINDVIAILQGISSDRSARVNGNILVRSGPEALAVALMRYRTTRISGTSLIDSELERRPPSLSYT